MSGFAPGTEGVFRDVPAEQYHKSPGVSNSMLKWMNPPARLPVYMSTKREPTVAMMLGTLTHALTLEPDKTPPAIALRGDPDKDDRFNFRKTAGKAWRDAQEAAGLVILKEDEYESVKRMCKSIAAHPLCKDIFAAGESEISCFARHHDTDILRKFRLDWLPEAGDALVDVKTCQDEGASEEMFSKTLYDLRYFVQAAYYLDGWNTLNPDNNRKHFVFIAVEKAPPFLVNVFHVEPDSLDLGREQYEHDLWSYRKCNRLNEWPGYGEGSTEIAIPPWSKKKLVEARAKEFTKYP